MKCNLMNILDATQGIVITARVKTAANISIKAKPLQPTLGHYSLGSDEAR